ncbi:FxsB family cyclophane-forming radical SAM/SPASM peptide maturase [Micromonospora sp. NPDC048898]|uniref:FxsB family cyclophane-forming radical SAM/SPASM peptide maturase n=1 Tax=Micromonospora sp. NPDC048898 TaxID=3364260 RepID=UPI003714F7BB
MVTSAPPSLPAPSEWPLGESPLDIAPAGWRPTPFHDFVVKLDSRCDLACDYCYMYELADRSWRGRTAFMPDEVVDLAAQRIAEHARDHRLSTIRVILHGGEPLLAPPATLQRVVSTLRAALSPGTAAQFTVQTNGTRLTEQRLRLLGAAGLRVGVSVDGGRVANDRHRRHLGGRSSFPAVDRALRLLREQPDLFAGILSVIDLRNDPVETYETLLAYQPPALDFLLPHGNWSEPPPGRPPDASTRYGEWLVAVFDRWYDAPRRETRLRLFEEIAVSVLGGHSRSEQIGLSPVGVIVIDVDGSLEQVDTLRSAYEGAPATGLTLADHPLDAALRHPAVIARQIGAKALAPACLDCSVHPVCGGGYYPHRYRKGSGFRNPSVYCADLRYLIDHIAGRVQADVARVMRQRA